MSAPAREAPEAEERHLCNLETCLVLTLALVFYADCAVKLVV